MNDVVLYPLMLSPIIGVATSLVKNFKKIPSYWYTPIALLLGIGYYLFWYFEGNCCLINSIANGIYAGGVASGAYSGLAKLAPKNKKLDAILNPLAFNRDNKNPINKLRRK